MLDSIISPVEEGNILGAATIQGSKFWRRILLDYYMRSDDILEMISGSVATMIAKKESDVDKLQEKLKSRDYYNTVATFSVIKNDFIGVSELEAENWAFKQPKKKSNRKKKDFGMLPLVDMLANGILKDYDFVENLPYNLIFSKISMSADQSWQ